MWMKQALMCVLVEDNPFDPPVLHTSKNILFFRDENQSAYYAWNATYFELGIMTFTAKIWRSLINFISTCKNIVITKLLFDSLNVYLVISMRRNFWFSQNICTDEAISYFNSTLSWCIQHPNSQYFVPVSQWCFPCDSRGVCIAYVFGELCDRTFWCKSDNIPSSIPAILNNHG